jgi:WD40 repeat protein
MIDPNRSRFVLLVASGILVLTIGCSNDPGAFQTSDGGPTTDALADGSLTDGNPCPSNVLCGSAGLCCDTGQECVADQCVAACASGVRCGSACCQSSELCLADRCVSPRNTCKDSFDCEEGEFCEPTLGKCLPQPPPAFRCEVKPETAPFRPILEWSWTGSTIQPEHDQVINMPLVADVDGDRIPEVIIVTSKTYTATNPGFLRMLDGKTGKELWPASAEVYMDGTGGKPDNSVNPRATPAIGDLDGDGTLEIVTAARAGGLIAFRPDGSVLWRSVQADGTTPYIGQMVSVTVALADLDGDGKGEAVAAGVVVDHTGKLTSDKSIGRERWGANDSAYGAVSIVADVDGNAASNEQYVVTGNRAIRRDGTLLWDVSSTLSDGYAAVADFDGDGKPELVVVAQGTLRIQDATTGLEITSIALPGSGRGGPPTIADFDADGKREIAASNGSNYAVFEYDSTAKQLSVKWTKETQDQSSNVTGSSVFDFEGDGAAEVVYNDECYSRVYDGKTGKVLWEVQNSSATIHEYPVLVDVDGDNNTELITIANDAGHGGIKCKATGGGTYTPRHGVFVYGDKSDRWVRTRRIWNQHAYHLTNINVDGSLPRPELPSWGSQGDNTYRVSSQGSGVYNAPDLALDLEVSTASCPKGLTLRARVKNLGSRGVMAGVEVTFFNGQSASAAEIGRAKTSSNLLPGQSEVVSVTFDVRDKTPPFDFFAHVDGGPGGAVAECREDNNGASGNGRCWGIK